jgi:hypothetical protein
LTFPFIELIRHWHCVYPNSSSRPWHKDFGADSRCQQALWSSSVSHSYHMFLLGNIFSNLSAMTIRGRLETRSQFRVGKRYGEFIASFNFAFHRHIQFITGEFVPRSSMPLLFDVDSVFQSPVNLDSTRKQGAFAPKLLDPWETEFSL